MYKAATQLIEDRLRDSWSMTDIDWDNVEYTPSRGMPFIRLQIEWVDTNQISMGGLNRGEGYTNISIYVPFNTGLIQCMDIADNLSEVYDKWSTKELKFKVARIVRVGQQEQWYRVDVITPFSYDECKPLNTP